MKLLLSVQNTYYLFYSIKVFFLVWPILKENSLKKKSQPDSHPVVTKTLQSL